MKKFFYLFVILTVICLAISCNKKEGTQQEESQSTNKYFKTLFRKEPLKNNDLQWSNKATNPMQWYSALNYCKDLNEGGFSDWKLPNIDELRTLIQYNLMI